MEIVGEKEERNFVRRVEGRAVIIEKVGGNGSLAFHHLFLPPRAGNLHAWEQSWRGKLCQAWEDIYLLCLARSGNACI